MNAQTTLPLVDLVGYEHLIDTVERHGAFDRPGTAVEIGTFLGGGAYKLAEHLARHHPGTRLQVIDVFDATLDATKDVQGRTMAEIYEAYLDLVGGPGAQERVYRAVIAGLANVDTHVGDSRLITDLGGPVCFGFVDGHHSVAAVRHDFGLVWSRLSPGGICALHDYGGDLPRVTATIDALIAGHDEDIAFVETDPERLLIYIGRRA